MSVVFGKLGLYYVVDVRGNVLYSAGTMCEAKTLMRNHARML